MSQIAAPYVNAGNPLVLSMLPEGIGRVLDVGCGGGDNARHLRNSLPGVEVVGLTHSVEEAEIAATYLDAVHVVDLEQGLTDAVLKQWGPPFDLLLFSHVLEHLREPVTVLRRCLERLVHGGHILIAVPNVLEWRTRLSFMRGSFLYTDHGILDRTHLRFFTYETAPVELIAPIEGLTLLDQRGRGSIPLGPLRQLGAAKGLCRGLDSAGLRLMPNFCAGETAMLARFEVLPKHD